MAVAVAVAEAHSADANDSGFAGVAEKAWWSWTLKSNESFWDELRRARHRKRTTKVGSTPMSLFEV